MKPTMLLLVLAVAMYGCEGDDDFESSFTVCDVRSSDCRGGTCREVEECEIDECETDADYFFDETEYESRCTFGETLVTIEYPLAGGPGRRETRRDVDECYYETEIDYDDGDIEEEGRCTRVRDCTIDTLDCDDSEPGDPDCRVIDSQPCPDGAAAVS
jgi:hypothetical protein